MSFTERRGAEGREQIAFWFEKFFFADGVHSSSALHAPNWEPSFHSSGTYVCQGIKKSIRARQDENVNKLVK